MTIKSLSLITATLLLTTNIHAEEDIGEITVVSATKISQNINHITANVNVITAQEIEERGFTTVTQALNSLPGISFTSNGGLGKVTSLYVRGMNSKRTLVLVDGIRYQDPSNISGASIQHLMTSDIERIEVIKGAQSGIWGADAAAGVVNIITKSAKEGGHASATIETGSFNTKHLGASVSTKTDRFDLKVSAYKLTSDGFTSQAPKNIDIDTLEDDAYENRTINLHLGIKITDNSKLTIQHTNIEGSTEYDRRDGNDTKAQSDFKTKLTSFAYTYQLRQSYFKTQT